MRNPLFPKSRPKSKHTLLTATDNSVDWINFKRASPLISIIYFRLIQLVVVLGTILAIVGAIKGDHNPNSPETISYIAAVLYAVTLVALILVLFVSIPSLPLVPKDERIILPVVALALLFITVRVLYSLLAAFVHSGDFVRFGGPIVVRVCMALIEEFAVVALYLFLGFRLVKVDQSEQGEILSRPWKKRRHNGRRHCPPFFRWKRYDYGGEQCIRGDQGTFVIMNSASGREQMAG